jgi:hypothetical protein
VSCGLRMCLLFYFFLSANSPNCEQDSAQCSVLRESEPGSGIERYFHPLRHEYRPALLGRADEVIE